MRPPFIDHITLKVRDLAASRTFYEAALAPFGARVVPYGNDNELLMGPEGSEDLGLTAGEPSAPIHIAFLAQDTATVDAFHGACDRSRRHRQRRPGAPAAVPRALLRRLRARSGREQRRGRVPYGA